MDDSHGARRQWAALLAALAQQRAVQVVDRLLVETVELTATDVRDDVAADDVLVVVEGGLLQVEFPVGEPPLQFDRDTAVG